MHQYPCGILDVQNNFPPYVNHGRTNKTTIYVFKATPCADVGYQVFIEFYFKPSQTFLISTRFVFILEGLTHFHLLGG